MKQKNARQNKNSLFSNRWGFVLAAVGSAVGMANVWGFPAKMGANGGGAFLLLYVFILIYSRVFKKLPEDASEREIARHGRRKAERLRL